MNGCLNILWHFPFFGFLFAFFYALFGAILCCTVILYPIGLGYFQIARFLLSPFTSALVTRKELDRVRPEERNTAAATYSTLISILYIPFGIVAAGMAVFVVIGEFLSIIGIPCGIVWFKTLPSIFNPVDKVCVPKAVSDEIARLKAGETVRRYKGETEETASAPAERYFTEDPGETLPPMPEVRQYDDAKLREIVANPAMYRASLVDDCRRELEIRSRSAEFTAQVRAMDNDKLREILVSPQLYAEELIYACMQEQDERRRVWREEQAKEEELQRQRREQEEKEAAQRRAAAWKKWRPFVFAAIAVLILAGIGAGYYSYHKEQVRLEQERIAQAKRMEQQRIAEQKRVEAERKRAEEKRIAAEKQRKEATARQAELNRLNSDVAYRNSKGIYRVGDIRNGSVVFRIDNVGKHGKALYWTQGSKVTWDDVRVPEALPTVSDLLVIYKNRDRINKALTAAGKTPLKTEYGAHYWSCEKYASASAWTISMYDGAKNSFYRHSYKANMFYVESF